MNSLTIGFLYVVGFSWALAETCVMAANGNWIPLIIFLTLFILMFSIVGCLKISDDAAQRWGNVFGVLLALGLAYTAFATYSIGSVGLGIVKAVFALGFVIVSLFSLGQSPKNSSSH